MKSKSIKIFLMGVAITSMLSSCGDSWFEREPKNILTNELVWNDPNMIKSQLANLYNRIPQLHGDFNTGGMCETDDAMYCGTLDQNYRNELRYGNDYGRWWDYGLIRDINMSIENIDLILPRQKVKPTSNSPAIINIIQFISFYFNIRLQN